MNHQASIISDFLLISCYRRKKLTYIPQVKLIVIRLKYITSFKKGKITKVEAASQNWSRRRIAI
jgi:hypothetical protein